MSTKFTAFCLSVVTVFCSVMPSLAQDSIDASAGAESAPELFLHDALGLAFEHNAAIAQARFELERLAGAKLEALSFNLPVLEGRANYERTDEDLLSSFDGNDFGTPDMWDTRLELVQPIYRGGQGLNIHARRKFELEASRFGLLGVLNEVFYSVKAAFYRVLLARELLVVQEQSVALLEEELQNQKLRLGAGNVSEFNVLRAEVALANATAPLIRARNEVKIAQEDLRRIIGFDSEAENPILRRISGELRSDAQPIALEQALRTAREKNPHLQRFRLLVDAAEKGVDVEVGGYLPQISARGSYGVEKNRFTDEFDDSLEGWRVGVDAVWTLFDSFGTKARVDQAKASERAAREELRQAILDVEVDVRRAHNSFIEAGELVRASEKVVEQGVESLRLANSRFDAGAATQLDVLDAQVALTDARSNRVQARHDYTLTYERLRLAMGLQAEKDERPAQ